MSIAKTTQKQSKSDFIRSQPAALSAAEVVERGKAHGVTLDVFLVYKVRSRLNARGKTSAPSKASPPPSTKRKSRSPAKTTVPKANARRTRAARKGAAVPRPIATASGAEELLKALAAELGLGLAIEILEGDRATVRAALGA
jgi:hypothetical protein